MPWSVLSYEDEIIKKILEIQQNNIISVNNLNLILMRATKLTNPTTLSRALKVFERLGYLKLRLDGFFEVNQERIKAHLERKDTWVE